MLDALAPMPGQADLKEETLGVMVSTREGRCERKLWMCGRVGVPRGEVDNSAAEVTLNGVLATASRPNIICCWVSGAAVLGFGFSAGTSDERSMTVQCGFDLPRVGMMNTRFRESSGIAASNARDVG